MKHLFTRVIILAAAAVTFGIQAHAQSDQQYRANVPFDFTAAGKTYAAGNYAVGRLSQAIDGRAILLIERKTGKARVIGITQGASTGNAAKLVFVRNGLHYALKEISTPSFGVKMRQQPQSLARASANDSQIIELALN